MRKKTILVAGIITILIAGVTFMLLNERPRELITNSPNGIFTITIKGESLEKYLPLFPENIDFDLSENGESKLMAEPLTKIDPYDNSFKEKFPTATWEDDNLLRLEAKIAEGAVAQDQIFVVNKTEDSLSYLVINALNVYVALDIPPRSRKTIRIPRYKWQSWVSVNGKFAQGSRFDLSGVNFLHKDAFESLGYCLSIESDRVLLSSLNVEGWTFKQATIPKVQHCEL